MNKITIAIDGFSSTGKSTVAKQLAKELGYVYVDSGAMYRAVTYYAMQNNFINADEFDKNTLIEHLSNIHITFKYNNSLGFGEVYLNGENIENAVRTLEVSQFVSQVAEVSEVRALLVKQQQSMGLEKGVVMDGRDIGTVVFPNAELKIFMTASADTRAKRRYEELIKKGEDVTYEDILENVKSRDFIDTNREDSPLKKAEDAIEIDNSNLTKKEQFELLLELCEQAIQNQA